MRKNNIIGVEKNAYSKKNNIFQIVAFEYLKKTVVQYILI